MWEVSEWSSNYSNFREMMLVILLSLIILVFLGLIFKQDFSLFFCFVGFVFFRFNIGFKDSSRTHASRAFKHRDFLFPSFFMIPQQKIRQFSDPLNSPALCTHIFTEHSCSHTMGWRYKDEQRL